MAEDAADRYPDSEGPFAGPNNTFPLNTDGRVRNAWARIHQGPTMANHSAEEITSIKTKIQAEAKKRGIQLEEHDEVGARALPPESTVERRVLASPVQVRSLPVSGGGPSRWIGGYAAVFGRESRLIADLPFQGPYTEQVNRGFFDQARSLGWPGNQGSGLVCRYNHKDDFLLGSVQAGTCEVEIDHHGLQYRTLTPLCREDVFELVGRGDVFGSSFTMAHCQDDWSYRNGVSHRTLISGQVWDVGPVSTAPAYQDATVGLRSLAAFKGVDPDDVFALAESHELRKLWVRTDQTLTLPNAQQRSVDTETEAGVAAATESAEQLQIGITTDDVAAASAEAAAPAEPAEDTTVTDPAVTEPPVVPESPALADEPPATLSWQEARLRLYQTRPYDPIVIS